MQEHENISPQQSLQVIQSMIETARNQISENGHLYLLWGWSVFFASIAQFILWYYFSYEHHYLVWLGMWIVFIYQTIYLWKREKKKRIKTYSDELIGYVWIVFVILGFLIGFLISRLPSGKEYYVFINPVILALYGMPTFLSGIILRFRPLVIGAVCCWALSIASTFINSQFHLLLIPAAMLAAWIIPGYLLRSRYKKQNN